MLLLAGLIAGVVLALVIANFIPNERKLQHILECDYGLEDPQFLRSFGSLVFPAPVGGNRITELRNGSAAFSEMLEAIRSARQSVTFETFIFWKGEVAQQFTAALKECAGRGVRVLVLLDTVGASKMRRGMVKDLRAHGCRVMRYHPLKWYHLMRLNNRTHRKLLVVDGAVGFTGGIGIGDEWRGNAEDPDHWRDSHFKIEGPVVGQMQGLFMINWVRVRAKIEHSRHFFPELPVAGSQMAQMFNSSPREGSENARLMFLFSIAAASFFTSSASGTK
jgi:cardiolipin synthase A/B